MPTRSTIVSHTLPTHRSFRARCPWCLGMGNGDWGLGIGDWTRSAADTAEAAGCAAALAVSLLVAVKHRKGHPENGCRRTVLRLENLPHGGDPKIRAVGAEFWSKRALCARDDAVIPETCVRFFPVFVIWKSCVD